LKTPEKNLVEQFKGKRICVVGDIIADIYIFGKPYRLSREAPVVVVKHEYEQIYPGSAGNTVSNLLALGARVFPVGFLGRDSAGNRLMDYFSGFATLEAGGIIRHGGETITKTRILAGDTHTSKQQVIRIDKDGGKQASGKAKTLLMKRLRDLGPHMDAFVVSDYGHGVVDSDVVAYMKRLAKETIVVGDARYQLGALTGFTIVTPNESEAYSLSGLGEGCEIEEVGKAIMGAMDLRALLITRGNKGMSLFLDSGQIHHIPISGTDDVTDVTGAGDTVCATVALSLASGADFFTASYIANIAAGVVVMKRGTATVSLAELIQAMEAYGAHRRRSR
jgi:D-glycero-beta-D-manno-heptose-7-phosphate kinase